MDRLRLQEYNDAIYWVKDVPCTDDRQREVLTNMYYAGCALIGGMENCLSDYPEDDPEYINADKCLADHEGLVAEVRSWCMSGYYGCGLEGPQRPYQKHYNLVGNAFIDRCAEAVVRAMGH